MNKPRRSRKDFFTPEQFALFLAACPPWLASFAEFGTLTGLRPGEIRRLERPNVTFRAGMALEDQEWGLIHLRADQTKSGREETIPLMPRAMEILKALPASIRHPELFFFGHGGRPISKHSLRHHFSRAAGRAGLQVARPHMLRHTAASWLIQRGVPLPIVQRILRHRNYATTEGYVHLLPIHLVPGMSVLAQQYPPQSTTRPTEPPWPEKVAARLR